MGRTLKEGDADYPIILYKVRPHDIIQDWVLFMKGRGQNEAGKFGAGARN